MELTWIGSAVLVGQLAMGVSLAACAGLRAFMPLFVVGLAGRLDLVPLSGSFEWLTSAPALVVFGVAVVVELLGDKFPGVDHFLDVVQTAVKPVAGTILVACVMTDLTPLQSTVLGIVLGGATAGAVHLLKAKARLVSTATTVGIANPLISTTEDVGAGVASVSAIFIPVVVLLLLLATMALTVLALRQFRRGRRRARSFTNSVG